MSRPNSTGRNVRSAPSSTSEEKLIEIFARLERMDQRLERIEKFLIKSDEKTKSESGQMTNKKKTEFILLLGVDDSLFMACFGDRSTWKCRLESLPEDCSSSQLTSMLQNPGLGCVVVEDVGGPHWTEVINYYKNGGFVVYFGIIGEYAAPKKLSQEFDLQWSFSAYTRYEYELTSVGKQILGDAITEQPYSKSNLLEVPVEDRILVPKHSYATVEELIEDYYDSDNEEDCVAKGHATYAEIRENLNRQVPLALHRASHGGQIAYLGFVNGDGNIPKIVQALCTGVKISND